MPKWFIIIETVLRTLFVVIFGGMIYDIKYGMPWARQHTSFTLCSRNEGPLIPIQVDLPKWRKIKLRYLYQNSYQQLLN